MRKVVFGGANSLDNYLAGPNHEVDWLMWGEEAAAVTGEFWKTIDTVLMGPKTFEVAAQSGQGNGYPGVKNYVFSRSLRLIRPAGSRSLAPTRSSSFVASGPKPEKTSA
jgi:dihydrofolate reductase